jgi:hypothetical protein
MMTMQLGPPRRLRGLWLTTRLADGTWKALEIVQSELAVSGPVANVAGTGGEPGETQFVLTTADGHLWHTLRRADGTWTGLGDVEARFGPGMVAVAAVAAADVTSGETQFMYVRQANGDLMDASRYADGTWAVNLDAGLAVPGPVAAVAGTGSAPGDTQFVFTTAGGHLWHTLNGTGPTDVQKQFATAIPGPVAAVAAANGTSGETQFVFTTADGHLWHTVRRADGTWTGLGDVQGQFAIPGAVTAVAGTGGAPGETQFVFTTADGHLWHTLRRADGTWTGLGNVQDQIPRTFDPVRAIPGRVAAVAAANGTSGETQFMFTTSDVA